jgi:DNA-binding NarL/FixJ family response regulator
LLRVVPPEPTLTFVPAERLWSALCDGLTKIHSFSIEESQVRVLVDEQRVRGRSVAGRRLRALELLFQGMSQTAIALELGVAASTVCADLKSALADLGVDPRVYALPPFLPQLRQWAAVSRLVRVSTDAREPARQTLVLPRLDLSLSPTLAPAEAEVCRLLLAGCSHQQIARARGRAQRTVANQLAAAFTKLKVSGRQELVTRLVRRSSDL